MKKRWNAFHTGIGIAFALFFSLPALGAEKLRFAIGYIPHIQFAPIYVAQEKGFYKQAGIDLDMTYGMGMDIFSLLTSQKIDIGLSDSDQLILAGAKGLPLKSFFQYYQIYPVSVVAKSDKIKNPQDLVGKAIGTPDFFGTTFIGLRLFLEKFHLQDKVKIEKIGYTQISSLSADRVAAVSCFSNNEPVQMRRMKLPLQEWNVAKFTEMVGASFLTSNETLKKRSQTLQLFYEATQKGMSEACANTSQAVNISLKTLKNLDISKRELQEDILKETCKLFGVPKDYGRLDLHRYEISIEKLASMGIIAKKYPAAQIVATGLKPEHGR